MKSISMLAAFLCASTLCATASDGDKPKSDDDLIQGTWKVVSAHEAGNVREVPDGLRFVVTADRLSIASGKCDPLGVSYKLDATTRPRSMDTSHELDPGKPIVQLAIYALDGDELKLCIASAGKARPTTFESKAGDTVVTWVLMRMKKDK